MHQAWRKNLTGVTGGPLPWFSGVKKPNSGLTGSEPAHSFFKV